MPRPQFSLKTLLWLMAVVAAIAWAWANMDPMPTVLRLLILVMLGTVLMSFAFILSGRFQFNLREELMAMLLVVAALGAAWIWSERVKHAAQHAQQIAPHDDSPASAQPSQPASPQPSGTQE